MQLKKINHQFKSQNETEIFQNRVTDEFKFLQWWKEDDLVMSQQKKKEVRMFHSSSMAQ